MERFKNPALNSFVLVVLLIGCSKRPTEFVVSGRITLDGKPLPEATISFLPQDPSHEAGITRTTSDGDYSLGSNQHEPGLAPGTYTVRISTYDEGDTEAEPPLPPVKEQVPSKYNYDSNLTVDVKSEPNVFDFDLDSKGRTD